MARIAWRMFDSGLWLAGGRDNCPPNTLRRAAGISQIKESALRSARGTRLVNAFGANQYIKFATNLFQSNGADVLRNGIAIEGSFLQTIPFGERLSFLRMPPQALLTDWLFMAGGNAPFKCLPDGTSPEKWGIDPPPDGFTATANDALSVMINNCDGGAGTWVRIEGAGATQTQESTIFVEGTASAKWAFTQAGTNSYKVSETLNLNQFGAAVSADQDFIQFWIRLSGAAGTSVAGADQFGWVEVAFSLDGTDFDTNAYSRKVDGVPGVISQAGLLQQQVGVGSVVALTAGQTELQVVQAAGPYGIGVDQRDLLTVIAQTQVMQQNDIWQLIRLPKSTFDRVGNDTTLNWKDVKAVRLTYNRTGAITIYVDALQMTGGSALLGNYQYYTTFQNSVTGSRSNPNPAGATATVIATPVLVQNVARQSVTLGNLPVSTDPQVDTVEIWRTLGNGEFFFLAFTVNNGTLTATDTVADFAGMFTGLGYLTASQLPALLQAIEVQFDNAPAPSSIREVYQHMHVGRAWALDRANPANVIYSPQGRPESIGGGGFVQVEQTDDPTMTLARWSDVMYLFTQHRLWRIVGTDEPFTLEEVFGAPGTLVPDSIVETSFGIIYQAPDGVRLFDGSFSTLLAFDNIAPIQRGYSVENFSPFTGITATFIRDEYWISDGVQTLCCLVGKQVWRSYGVGAVTLYTADDGTEIFGATGLTAGTTLSLEDFAQDTGVAFEVEMPQQRVAVDTQALLQRIFIELTTPVVVTPTLILDDGEIALPPIPVTAGRVVYEYGRQDLARLVGLRLTASSIATPIILYGVEADIYVPYQPELVSSAQMIGKLFNVK